MKPHRYSKDSPEMIPSFVCYADILGFSQQSKESLESKKGNQFLGRLRTALTKAYERLREHAKGLSGDEFFSIKVFTDNIVVGYPISKSGYGEPELGEIFRTFSEFQVSLALEGFLVRGGVAFGLHYMDDDIVFGDALLEAIAQDKGGGPPCISLAPSAIRVLQHHLSFYGETDLAPQSQDLLEDSDGTIYLNYLVEAFVAFPDGGVFFELIKGHKDTIVDGLKKYKNNPGVRSKYEWAARYHNFICQEFAETHKATNHPDEDEMYAAATVEAQNLLHYIIDIESLAATPSRISLKPIRL